MTDIDYVRRIQYGEDIFRVLDDLIDPYLELASAVDAMMAALGHHGTISARDDKVQAVMDVLARIDPK